MEPAVFEALNDCYSIISLLYWREQRTLAELDRHYVDLAKEALDKARPLLEPEWRQHMGARRG